MKWLEKMIDAAVERVVFRHVKAAVDERMQLLIADLTANSEFCSQVAEWIDEKSVAEEIDVSKIIKKIDYEALATRISQNFWFQQETCRQLDYARLGKAVIASIKASS
jgi:hypothetical protein